jgi:ATP-dependent protease ClpP protease subunit
MKEKIELPSLPYKKMSRGDVHVFSTPSDIDSLEPFLPMLDILAEAHEDDIVKLEIFCYGGCLSVVKTLTNALMRSKALVHTVNKGVAYSGGSALLMAGDTIEVEPFSNLMIHSSHGWQPYDTEQELYTSTEYHRKELVEYYNEIYKGFLDEDEISTVLAGTPMWMSAEEQNVRLEKLFAAKEAEFAKVLAENAPPSREDLKKLTKDQILEKLLGPLEDVE